MRQIGLRSSDLDPVGRGYLDLYVRLAAKLDLLDEHFAAVGLIGDDGTPNPATAFYVSVANSTRLALAKVETHFDVKIGDPVDDLRRYLDAKDAAGA